MKFGEYIKNNQISEWIDFYIDYSLLKKIMKKFEKRYKFTSKKIKIKIKIKINNLLISLNYLVKKKNLDDSYIDNRVSLVNSDGRSIVGSLISNELDIEEENLIQLNFKKQIFLEIEKVGFFFSHNINFYKIRLKKIKVIFF